MEHIHFDEQVSRKI